MGRKEERKLDRCLIELENLVKEFEDQVTYKKAFDSYFKEGLKAFDRFVNGGRRRERD